MTFKSFTVPSLSTLEINRIKDFSSVEYELPELRLVELKGTPVRIEINKNYVEVNSSEEEINLEKYKNAFQDLFKFFYGTGYLFGFVYNNELKIYDVYTNNNFLSTRDMYYLESNYNIPIVKPIAEGNFTYNYLITVLNKKISEGINACDMYLFPCMYLEDKREYITETVKTVSNVIIGEKRTWNYTSSIQPKTDVKKVVEFQKPKTDMAIFSKTTKKEREDIKKEVYKNISNKLKECKDEEVIKWWKTKGQIFSYLYSIHTLPSTRQIVYDYCKNYAMYIDSSTLEQKWGCLFLDMFDEKYNSIIKNKIIYEDYEMFSKVFKEELIEFDKFFVLETDKKYDWRFNYGIIV